MTGDAQKTLTKMSANGLSVVRRKKVVLIDLDALVRPPERARAPLGVAKPG